MSKKELGIMLSRLKVFESPSMKLEQYPTDSDIASDLLWNAKMRGDIEGKIIADLGSGTGILGLGALAIGAKKVFFVDIDEKAMSIAKENKSMLEKDLGKKLNAEFLVGDVNLFDKKIDVVIMNPPFGTKSENVDTVFLLKAMSLANVIYSFHKSITKEYIERVVQSNGFRTTHYIKYDFPLKQTMASHVKRIERIRVGLWRIEKNS